MTETRQARGILGISNCIAVVPQDEWYAVEHFGSFSKALEPGLRYAGCDMCGICINLRALSTRVVQVKCTVKTKTLDNTFVDCVVMVQMSPLGAMSVYKLSNPDAQVDAYVSDVVRSSIPKMNLDDIFLQQDQIGNEIQQILQGKMEEYHYKIHKALLTEIKVDKDVMMAMNEVNKQKRLKEATEIASEAAKVRIITNGQAQAEVLELQGKGIARQRSEIINGLRGAMMSVSGEEKIDMDEMTHLMLASQYFETLKEIGAQKSCRAYYLPSQEAEDTDSQVKNGFLQGIAGMNYMLNPPPPSRQADPMQLGGGRLAGGGRPAGGAVAQLERVAFSAPPQQFRPPQQNMGFSPPGPSLPAPITNPSLAPAQSLAAPKTITMEVQIPAGIQGGQIITIQAPTGKMVQVRVPMGIQPGQKVQFQVPA